MPCYVVWCGKYLVLFYVVLHACLIYLVRYAGLRVVSVSCPCSALGLCDVGVAFSGCTAAFAEVKSFGLIF